MKIEQIVILSGVKMATWAPARAQGGGWGVERFAKQIVSKRWNKFARIASLKMLSKDNGLCVMCNLVQAVTGEGRTERSGVTGKLF